MWSFFRIGAGFLRENQELRQRDHLRRYHNLIGAFRDRATAAQADISNLLRKSVQNRTCDFERTGVAADHDRQRSVDRADLTAADRRVERLNPGFLQFGRYFSRQFGESI